MKHYRIVVTGPERDLRYSIQKKTFFGWKEIDHTIIEDRAQSIMDELVNGPKVIREEVVV